MKRFLIALTVVIPLALFVVARQFAAKRPLVIGQHQGASGLLISPDGTRMLSQSNSDVVVWNLATRKRESQWKSGLGYVFSRDGQRLATVGERYTSPNAKHSQTEIFGAVREARTGKTLLKFSDVVKLPPHFIDAVHQVQWSSDERAIWVLSDAYLRHFDARSGRLLKRVELGAFQDYNSSLGREMLPDGSLIVSSGYKNINFRDTKTGVIVRSWKVQPPVAPNATAFISVISPNSKWLAVGFDGKAAASTFFYRASGGKAWELSSDSESFLRFSPDSRLALSVDPTHFIARDVRDGHEGWRLNAPSGNQFSLAPDNRFAYNIDSEGIIRRWNVPTS